MYYFLATLVRKFFSQSYSSQTITDVYILLYCMFIFISEKSEKKVRFADSTEDGEEELYAQIQPRDQPVQQRGRYALIMLTVIFFV